jgi:hypothetical protein
MTNALKAQMSNEMHNCGTVPDEVFSAVYESIEEWRLQDPSGDAHYDDHTPDRADLTQFIAKRMAAQGWRFCSCYRHENTPAHSLIYSLVSPIRANGAADDLLSKVA